MSVKRILVVSQYFYPESFRINDMCVEWVKRGYEVTVVTGIPNYPMGKIYPGYGWTKKRREEWNGIHIIRLPLIPRGKTALGMVLNYVSFMVSGMWAGRFLRGIQADVVFSFEVSPMTQVKAGVQFAKRLRVPHFLYIQDLWPENVMTVTGIHCPLVIRPIQTMVDKIYRNSDKIFATSPRFVEAICRRKKAVPAEKVHFWPQYAEEFYRPVEQPRVEELPPDDTFKLIFTGNIGTAQGLSVLPKTAALLKNDKVTFVIVGDGRYLATLKEEVQAQGVSRNFVFIPRKPAQDIPAYLCSCDAAFVSFANDPLWTMTIPAKLQSYMACGMPVLACAAGETARVLAEADGGLCCPIGDAEALAKLILQAKTLDMKAMGERARLYAERYFNKKRLMDEMDTYFNFDPKEEAYGKRY